MASQKLPDSMLQSSESLDARELMRFSSWLFAGAVVGAVIAYALAFVWPPKWEAVVQIRPGQIASTVAAPTPLESPARIVERLNSKTFGETIKTRLGYATGGKDPRGKLIDDTLKATVADRASLVSLKIEGMSREDARLSAEAVIAQLAEVHDPMFRPTVDRLKQQRRETQADIERIAAERDRIVSTMPVEQQASRASERFSESVLIGNLVNIRDSELRTLRDRAAMIDEQLSPERTYPTGAIDRVFVPDRPSFPRKSIHAVIGAILGAMAGGILALVVRGRS